MATTPEVSNPFELQLETSVFSNDSGFVLPHSRRTTRLLLALMDFVMIWAASAVALILRSIVLPAWNIAGAYRLLHFHFSVHVWLLLLYSGLVILSCHTHNLYRGLYAGSAWHEVWMTIRAVGMATILLGALIFVLRANQVSRVVVGVTAVLSAAALVLRRLIGRRTMASCVAAGHNCRNVLIVGAGPVGRALQRHLNDNKQFGYLVKGLVDRRREDAIPTRDCGLSADDQILGPVEELPDISRALFVDEVLITIPDDRELVKLVAAKARDCGLAVRVVPDLYDGLAWRAPIEYLGLFPTMSLHQEPIREIEFLLKRAIDIVISSAALLCASPIMVATALAIYLDDPGPIFYRSLRVGKKGKTFQCVKFRTMVVNADRMLDSLRYLNEREGLLFKISNDPRLTRLGRWLRKYSLDELPQLWNVLKGEMSLVGPRPPLASEFEQYDLEYFRRLDAVPGITGLWQVEARQSASFETYINLDLHYIEHWSLLLDLKLLLKTIGVVLAGTGR